MTSDGGLGVSPSNYSPFSCQEKGVRGMRFLATTELRSGLSVNSNEVLGFARRTLRGARAEPLPGDVGVSPTNPAPFSCEEKGAGDEVSFTGEGSGQTVGAFN